MCAKRWLVVGVIVAAWLTVSPVAFSEDPDALEDVIAQVHKMHEDGRPNGDLAKYLTGVVGRRITRGNSPVEIAKDAWRTESKIDHFNKVREEIPSAPGRIYEAKAKWAWMRRYGNCAEAACIAYYVLKEAGVPARFIECTSGGHDFVMIGMDPNAKVNDADTWGDDAYFVDGWFPYGTSDMPARDWVKQREKGYSPLNFWGATRDPKREDVTNSFDSPKQYDRFLHNGVLRGMVVDEGGKPAADASVSIRGEGLPGGPRTLTPKADGSFNTLLPPGEYQVEATAPAPSGPARFASDVVHIKPRNEQTDVYLVLSAKNRKDGKSAEKTPPEKAPADNSPTKRPESEAGFTPRKLEPGAYLTLLWCGGRTSFQARAFDRQKLGKHPWPVTLTVNADGTITGECQWELPDADKDPQLLKTFTNVFDQASFRIEGVVDWSTGRMELRTIKGKRSMIWETRAPNAPVKVTRLGNDWEFEHTLVMWQLGDPRWKGYLEQMKQIPPDSPIQPDQFEQRIGAPNMVRGPDGDLAFQDFGWRGEPFVDQSPDGSSLRVTKYLSWTEADGRRT